MQQHCTANEVRRRGEGEREAETELETAGKATHDFVWLPLKIKFNKPHYVYIGVVPKSPRQRQMIQNTCNRYNSNKPYKLSIYSLTTSILMYKLQNSTRILYRKSHKIYKSHLALYIHYIKTAKLCLRIPKEKSFLSFFLSYLLFLIFMTLVKCRENFWYMTEIATVIN